MDQNSGKDMKICIADMSAILTNEENCRAYFADMICGNKEGCAESAKLSDRLCIVNADKTQEYAQSLCRRTSDVVTASMTQMDTQLRQSHKAYWDSLPNNTSRTGSNIVSLGHADALVDGTIVRPKHDQ